MGWCKTARGMGFRKGVTIISLIVSLCGGCAAPRAPLRSVPVSQRAGARVIDVTSRLKRDSTGFGTANTQALRAAAQQTGLVPALILRGSAANIEGKGIPWVNEIRAKSGIHEPDTIVESVRERIAKLDGQAGNGASDGPLLEVFVVQIGIAELERGGFFGVTGEAQANLKAADKLLWKARARSTSTHLRRTADYDANPALYAEDFREVAQDIARQLVEGPIR